MWAFIGSISLVASIVLLIIGIVGKVKKRVIVKRSFLISLGAFVLFIVAIANTPTANTKAAQESPEASKVVASESPDSQTDSKEKEEADAKTADELKKKEEAEKALLKDPAAYAKAVTLKHFSDAEISYTTEDGWLEIKSPGRDGVTNGIIRDYIQEDITATLKDLKEQPDIKDVVFRITLPATDKFGNESVVVAVNAVFLKATRDKINWDNFSYLDLPDIADSYGVAKGLE